MSLEDRWFDVQFIVGQEEDSEKRRKLIEEQIRLERLMDEPGWEYDEDDNLIRSES
jgi:hypothetical protein